MARKRRRPRSPSTPGRLPWDELLPTLDLHGLTAAEARRTAERWLRERRDEGVGQVRLVTGRGLHSAGPPVLPGEIADLLGGLRGSVVARVSSEPGGGAFRVELRRPRGRRAGRGGGPATSPSPAAPDVPPDLLREAEETLAELGVTPTPALLAAEVRRLLARREKGE